MKKTAAIILTLIFLLSAIAAASEQKTANTTPPIHVIKIENVSVILETTPDKPALTKHSPLVLKQPGTAPQQKLDKDLRAKIQKKPKEKIPVLIQLEKEEDLDAISDLIKTKQGEVIGKYKIGDIIAANISADKIEDLSNHSSIRSISPDRTYRALLDKSVPQINAPSMWAKGYNGSGIKIAILDTGINTTHPMLSGKVILQQVFTGENHTNDVNGHGTHIAGIAAGIKVSNESYNGVAPGALLINAKVLNDTGSGDDISIINGINWAVDPDGNTSTKDGADIISISFGAPYSDLNSPILTAIKDAVNRGVVVVAAAGNCGSGCPGAPCSGYIGIETPGNSPDAITVGAVNDNNNWACFSSGGIVNGSIKPDVVAPGVNIISSVPGSYAAMSGTSMSAPHVAGAAALLLQSNRNLTPEQVKYTLENTAVHLGEPGKNIKYGSGIIDASSLSSSNVNKLLGYRLTYPQTVHQNETLEILVNATFENIARMNATITAPNKTAFYVNFTNRTTHTWNATFKNTSMPGVYALDVFILDRQGNITVFNKKFDVIRYSSTSGIIKDIVIPASVPFNETLPISIVFQNTGNSSLDALVEAQILDGNNLIGSIYSNSTAVNPVSIKYFNLSWTANAPLGIKTVKAIANYDGNANITQKNFTIIDNKQPVISAVRAYSTVSRNNSVLIEVDVNDVSDISGNITVKNPSGNSKIIPLKAFSKINYVSTLTGTYIDTASTGLYTFNMTICDSAGFCTQSNQSSFNVVQCSSPQILVVSEQENSAPDRFTRALNNSYCVGVWNKPKSGVPELSYLQRFGAVIWSTGNYWGDNVDSNSSSLLINYTLAGGKLVLEGPDIAFEHGYDELMRNVSHSQYKEDFVLSGNQSQSSIIVTRSAPIFKGLPGNISFNASLCPYPDALIPTNGGVELAQWNINGSFNGSAIIAFNAPNPGSRTLLIPFTMDAMGSFQNTFIKNIADWIMTDENNADMVVGNISYNYLIKGNNSINISIENRGSLGATNAKIDIFIDNVSKKTSYVNVPAGSKTNLTSVLTFDSGMHELKVELNSNYNITERNYLNNLRIENLSVATVEADLIPKSLSFDIGNTTVNISVQIQNKGGSNAVNATVEFRVDNNLTGTRSVNAGYNQTAIASVDWQKNSGIFDVLVKVNPSRSIVESNYSNNNISGRLYVCNKSSVLIVDDNDAQDYSTENPSSADDFDNVLKNNGYCTSVWSESEKGVPGIEYLNQFDSIIWSAGDYWNNVINESDVALLQQYKGRLIVEGADIAFNHTNDTFMQNYLHSQLDRDMILSNQTDMILGVHEIFNNISNVSINKSLCPYPDSLVPTNGMSIANWSDANSSIIIFNDSDSRVVYYGFSIDGVADAAAKEKLMLNSLDWVAGLKDKRPPASVTNLRNTTYAQTYINWTWVDPRDADFSRVMVYLDGVFKTNVSKGVKYYNASGLAQNTGYTISTHTVDTSGNINSTWVNHTAKTAVSNDTIPPASVTNLTNVTYTANSIKWTWTDPADSDFSKVMVYLNGAFKTNVSKGVKYYLASGLAQNTSYIIATRTIDLSGNINSTWVNHTARTAVDITPPASITNLTNVTYVANSINWTWTDPADSDFSRIIVYIDGSFKTNVSKGVRYYLASGLGQNTTHTIATRTVDLSGNINQTWINHTARTAVDITPSTSITNLTNVTYVANSINWTWTDPADSDFSKVTIYIDGSFKTNVSKGVKCYLASGLAQNTSYTIATRTIDLSGNINSTWVNHTARTAVDITPPASITNLTNVTYVANSINWTWTDPTDADFSKVMVYLDGVFKTNISKGVRYYLASGLGQNTTYTVATRTVDLSGNINQTWINHTARTAVDVTPPASITNLKNITYSANSINWTWNDPTDTDLSKVMIYIDGIFKSNVSKGLKYYLASGFGQNTTHTIATKTVDLSGNTNQTWVNHTARTAVDVTPPASVTNLKNTTCNANSINWTWADPADSDLSYVKVYLDGVLKTNVTKGVEYYLASNLIQNTSHTIATRTVDLSGNMNSTWINHTARTAIDTTPPASVTNLINNSFAAYYINWTWTDPADSDFSQVKIYIDGLFKTNISKGKKYYLASDLTQNTTHTISTRTEDTYGNINQTWINHTANTGIDTAPPASITNLNNISYAPVYINWSWTDPADADFSHVMVYIDGILKTNVSKGISFYNATGIAPDNEHAIATRAVDINGNINLTWINHTAKTAPLLYVTVDDSSSKDYTSIQAGVNNASAGATIIVYSGTYYENLNLTKQVTLRGINSGEGKPVINAGSISDIVVLSADGITFEGFYITNSGSVFSRGILAASKNNIIKNNDIFLNNGEGILLNGASNNNTLSGNSVPNGPIWLEYSSNHILTNNYARGIIVIRSDNNTLTNNTAELSHGILLYASNNNFLTGNTANSNGNNEFGNNGIRLDFSNNNILANNTANFNGNSGISLGSSSNYNTLSDNTADSNGNNGIELASSDGNIVKSNRVQSIYLHSSGSNQIYNNQFNNSFNLTENNPANTWNIDKVPGTNIIGGPYLGGNFWAYSNGTGFSQTCSDNDADGICDNPYSPDENNIDYLPLTYYPIPP